MNKIKNYLLTWLIPLLLVIIMAGCDDRAGLTAPEIISTPSVSSTNPANTATSIPFNQMVTATFSEAMDSLTLTTATFTLMQGTSFVSGTVHYTGTTATFSPLTPMDANTNYTATITTMAKSSNGTPLASNYVWSFSTGMAAFVIPPSVSLTDPVNGAFGIPINQKVSATFSVAMDAATITTSTFTLMNGSSFVSGFVSYSGTTAIFSPAGNLLANTAYTATITTASKDIFGNSLAANYTWTFTTGAVAVVTPPSVSSTDPGNTATGIALNQKIAATFSKTMDASTITTAAFTLMQGTTFVSGTVSYVGTTALYVPTSNLVPNTIYTATINTGAKDLSGNALANNYVWSFTTGAAAIVTPPSVSSTDPLNVATGVALNQKIAVSFSRTMDASTITTAVLLLKNGIIPVPGFVSYSGTTATFAPGTNLLPNTTYNVTVTTGAQDLAGNALAANYNWSFTTGAAVVITPPTISFTDPLHLATAVALNQKIAATFSKTMDAATITTATFTLMQGLTFVSGTVSYVGTTATYKPSSNLTANTVYTATITTGAKDLSGNALLNNYVWTFTTGAAPIITPPTITLTDPLNAETGVALNQKIAAAFSKTMDASTITASTFTLKQGTTSIAGFVSYSGITALFAPTINLLPNTTYSASITTGAKDLAGNSLESIYSWSFTTGAIVVITPPSVLSSIPLNNAVNVALNQNISAVFSKTMDAATITSATFTLVHGLVPVPGFVSYSGVTASFILTNDMLPNTVYTATITTGAKDLAGNSIQNNYIWSFTTASGIAPPTVIATNPLNNAIGVALNQKVSASFSKTMDASTITTATFTLAQGAVSISGFVSYSGTTGMFTPAENLLPNTVYTATITTGAKDLAGNSIQNNYIWSFTTASGIAPPTVIATNPLNNAIGVALNQKVSASFSKTMDASTITTATFTLAQGAVSISGFVSYSGTTGMFTPAENLLPNTLYTATITTGAKDSSGSALQNNYVWSFTTVAAAIAPTVVLTDPLNGATAVLLTQKLAATFSTTMNAATINTTTFTLKQGVNAVSGFVSYTGLKATFVPASDLLPNTLYTVTITKSVEDIQGNAMVSDYSWSFTTLIVLTPAVTLTDPLNLATGVALNKKITATFNKVMDASTITTATFTVRQGVNVISGFVSYSGNTATFAPNNNLVAGLVYTATITTGAKDLAGNALQSNHNWTFTTILVTPPTVTMTDPLNGATGVALDKTISATFSKPMDDLTISSSTFIVKQGTTVIAGFVSYSGLIATFNPTSSLWSNATYTVTITTGAKDSSGTPLVSNYVWTFNTALGAGGLAVNLGTAARFAILSNSAITNIPTSSITGDVGISPGARASITGLTLPEVIGTIFAADDAIPVPAMLIAAKADAEAAYADATAAVRGTPISISGNINGLTLTPGLYESGSSIQISPGGIVYLDAQGDVNAVFVIRSATSITTSATSNVILTNGAKAKNIFWSAGSAVTLGTNSRMKGTIIASTSISLLTGARLDGRALIQSAAAGQVSLDQNIIVKP